MTHQPRYNVRTVAGAKDQTDLTLYEAVKVLKAANAAGKIRDASRITRLSGGRERFVAFYSGWELDVVPAFQAQQTEADVLNSWAGRTA